MIAPACLLAALLFRGPAACAEPPGEIDQTGQWERHLIDASVNRDHGHSVGDASHPTSAKRRPKAGGIVYFRMTDDPTDPWQKIRVAPAPELGRQCQAADVDGDGDLDVVSTADHNMAMHTISVVWWENKVHVRPRREAGE